MISEFIRPEPPDFHGKMYIWPPYWMRHLNIFCDLKNPRVIVLKPIAAKKLKIY